MVQQHAAATSEFMKEQPGVCQEVSVNALQAKATARVDVPETSNTQGYGVELEETEKVKQSFPVFLRTLQGRHHVMSCSAGADLYERVASVCHMPCERFMLVHRSKIVQEWGVERDATLTLTLRMLGGSVIPGEWHCALCNRGGCWHTKAWCFRCGTSRAKSEAILPSSAQWFLMPGKGSGKGKGVGKGVGLPPQREQRYPGRPAPSSDTVAGNEIYFETKEKRKHKNGKHGKRNEKHDSRVTLKWAIPNPSRVHRDPQIEISQKDIDIFTIETVQRFFLVLACARTSEK